MSAANHSTVQRELNKPLLHRAIAANAVFSGSSGLVMILLSGAISRFLGLSSAAPMIIAGVGLLAYAPFLLQLSRRDEIPQFLVWLVIDLDVLWVIGSAVLIFSSLVVLTPGGKWALAIVADIVAAFAIVQYIGFRRLQS